MMGFGMMGGGLFGLLFMGLIIYLIISFFNNGTFYNIKNDNPLEILKERYARGEISEEEYVEKRKILKR